MVLSARLYAALPLALLVALNGCNQSNQAKAPAVRPPSQASLDWQAAANGFVQSYFAAQPFFAAQAGQARPLTASCGRERARTEAEVARLHEERDRIAGIDPKPCCPTSASDRGVSLSVGPTAICSGSRRRTTREQSVLVRRQRRSRPVPEPKLRAARCAHEGVHQIRARYPENGQGYPG